MMTPEAYRDRVRALLPDIRERVEAAEQLRRFPDETFKAFQEAGLFRAVQPKRYGGYELDLETFYQAVIEVGEVCASSAWILGVVGIHNWQMALFPQQAQDDVWGEDSSLQLSTSLSPTGHVERAGEGFRLQGRWSFSSGCDFCQWVLLSGAIPPQEAGGAPEPSIFLLPRQDYEIDDNWDVIGLCASGSKDIVVEDAWVPPHRVFSLREAFELRSPGLAVNTAPLYRLPFSVVFSHAVSTPALGVALGALEAFRQQTKTRVRSRDKASVAEDPFIHMHLSETTAEVEAWRDRVLNNLRAMMQQARTGEELSYAQRARYRWDKAHAVTIGVRAVDRLFSASGGRAIFRSNPLQRAWRDVHAIRAHAGNDLEKIAPIFGRIELDLPPNDMRF
jgi:3-hydroxy-9,10-secoandrosta-1,3,5(10)-triene-9,17-dione monooxygenase